MACRRLSFRQAFSTGTNPRWMRSPEISRGRVLVEASTECQNYYHNICFYHKFGAVIALKFLFGFVCVSFLFLVLPISQICNCCIWFILNSLSLGQRNYINSLGDGVAMASARSQTVPHNFLWSKRTGNVSIFPAPHTTFNYIRLPQFMKWGICNVQFLQMRMAIHMYIFGL